MPRTADSRSASSKTTAAPFPPSSISCRFMPRPHTSAIRRPTAVEPVKLTMSTSSESTAASPTSGARAADDVHDARWHARRLQRLGHPVDGERVLRGRLHDDRVAHGQRRGDLPGRVRPGVVVRGDAGDHAHRLAHGQGAQHGGFAEGARLVDLRGQRLLDGLHARVPLETGRPDTHLHPARGAGRRAGLCLRQFGVRHEVAADRVCRPAEDRGPLLGGRARPGPEGLAGRGGRSVRLIPRGLRSQPGDTLARRVDHLVVATVRLHPRAADEQPLPVRHLSPNAPPSLTSCSPSACPAPTAAPSPARPRSPCRPVSPRLR